MQDRQRHLSHEHRAKIAAARRGQRHSAETRAKISESMTRRSLESAVYREGIMRRAASQHKEEI